jgi:hypothetical protein
MRDQALITTGIVGSLVAALCCATPLLANAVGSRGAHSMVGQGGLCADPGADPLHLPHRVRPLPAAHQMKMDAYDPHRDRDRHGRAGRQLQALGKWHDPGIRHHLSRMRDCAERNHADRRLPLLLRMQRLWRKAAAQTGPLLRVLLLRVSALSANSSRAGGRESRRSLRLLGSS